MPTLTPIKTAFVAPHNGSVAVFAETSDGRYLRHLVTDWDDAQHPHEIARVIAARGRISEEYWIETGRVSRSRRAA